MIGNEYQCNNGLSDPNFDLLKEIDCDRPIRHLGSLWDTVCGLSCRRRLDDMMDYRASRLEGIRHILY